jgi:DNA-binding GntR family transcriptional regulator
LRIRNVYRNCGHIENETGISGRKHLNNCQKVLRIGVTMYTEIESSGSQAVKAQLRLRELILSGDLPGGARIAELALVEKLGVSRTPIRAALMRLEQEGLLEVLPNGGYAVRTFSERDVSDAIELRGTLEGLMARLAAERGVAPVVLREARECLDQIDEVLRRPALDDETFPRYVHLNQRFHTLLVEMAASPVIARELERVVSLPFASPSGFVLAQARHAHRGAGPAPAGAGSHRAARGRARRGHHARARPHRPAQPARGGAQP